ncbi:MULTISPECIES: host specificity factor TipJ family phage tail protein [Serratia]|uniref:host specificity factor TipJ family phage tail protein n=1 Tax=Serratia TaxID=613 RepID=UPI00131F4A6A|nr:host specificity factor TipJ family phage tail protein [Serratia marcescens]ELH4238951.1 MoaD/ThiS family protein [Serratia marcescens]ELM0003358.1 MoaD/ThiS family protein [Serratia marcescens]MBH3240598.1 MoaD/ThiS family protein [Serratia marcescens]MBN5410184.1 MoaD/ThiS family protein [Serratia marcescens]MBN5410242.1 MoaD/ThiS family protein [Serratia marcescens]
MPLIEVQRVPGLPKERHNLPAGSMFYPWLKSANLHCDVEILCNGVKLQPDDELNFPLNDGDVISVFDQPKSGTIGKVLSPIFAPIKFVQKILMSLLGQPSAGVATSSNAKTSPNNSLKGQTNIARNGEAKPDNYGQVRAYPDLIQESLFEYDNNIKKVTEWMNFGLGRYDVTSVRYSESNLGALAGASYRIYQPGENIPLINEGFAFDDIDGQELPGPNESGDFPAETATTTTDMVSGEFIAGQAKVKIKQNSDFDYFYDLSKPHSVSFVVNVTYNTVSGPVTRDITVFADLFSATTTDDGAPVNPQYFYEFTFVNLSGNDISQIPDDAVINTSIFTLNDNEPLVIGPSFSPVDGTQLWVHLQAQLGHGDYARTSVTFWKVDDDNNQIPGTLESYNIGLNNDDENADTKYDTFKFIPVSGNGRYAVTFIRTNNSNDHSILKVEAVHIVRTRTNVVYPNDTLVTVTVTATERATSARERKYNALITRHVISYNLATQTVDYTERPSRSFADAVLHTWLKMGGQPESSIDIYELYSIAASLSDQRLGYFDYTFDDEDISLGSRIQTICDAATVTAFWDGGVLSFTRDERKPNATTVFNRANMKAEDYSLSYDMTLPGGFDGVEVKYRNPVTNKQAFIRYRIVGNSIEEGEPVKAKKFDMLFIRNSFQARDRALKEVRRLLYSRQTMTIRALADGEWVNVGQMVQVADIYDANQQDGYIVARNGNNFDTSERIEWSGDMFVVVTDAIGAPTARVQAFPRTDTIFGFAAAVPAITLNLYDGYNTQSPSRYVIATQMEMDATKWTITEKKPNGDGTTSLTMSEYNDEMYNYEVTA